ncbi:MAG: ATP-binding protein, partial [Cyanobacteria bacterium J06555_13]
LGQMVAGVAHEINNPAGFVYSNIKPAQDYVQDLFNLIRLYQQHFPDRPQVIREEEAGIDIDFIETDLPNLLASMKSGAGRIREIVLNLRDFSRKDESAMKTVNLNDGLESTLLMLSHRLTAQPGYPDIEVIKSYGRLPAINCFASEINQVFMNIIGNALDGIQEKMMSQNVNASGGIDEGAIAFSPQIRIQTQTQDNHCIVKISNNGALIPKDIQAKIFDPFFTTKAVGQGTGLGLSISYHIITKQHNGKIECQSTPHTGTEFVIRLPIT